MHIGNILCIIFFSWNKCDFYFDLDNDIAIGASWIEKSYVNVGRYRERKNKMGSSFKRAS